MRRSRVEIVRVYEDSGRSGAEYRVLVDRLWPRGVRKESLDLDEWAREAAPSTDLRRWYGHVPERFEEFSRRYRLELKGAPGADALESLAARYRRGPMVLLTATRDVERSGAEVLRSLLTAKVR
ncbi:MAG: DUF488 domain-containing protein [Acidimicrobiales bacterium]